MAAASAILEQNPHRRRSLEKTKDDRNNGASPVARASVSYFIDPAAGAACEYLKRSRSPASDGAIATGA